MGGDMMSADIKRALAKIIASRAARLKKEGGKLANLCFYLFGGQINPTDLLPQKLRTKHGFVIASEEMELPGGRIVKVLGLEVFQGCKARLPEAEPYIELYYPADGGCHVWTTLRGLDHIDVENKEDWLSELSVSLLVRFARLLERMTESVRQRIEAVEDFERRSAERLADEVREMLAEDVVGGGEDL
jgi:hypothetical protein